MQNKFAIRDFTEDCLEDVISFLLIDEVSSITLVSRFFSKGRPVVPPSYIKTYLIYIENDMKGVLSISESGAILHHFDKKSLDLYFDDMIKLVRPVFKLHRATSIIGEKKGTDFLLKVLEGLQKPSRKIDYTLMEFTPEKALKCPLPNGFDFVLCTLDDTDFLYPLQMKYDLAEVLPENDEGNSEYFRKGICRLNLRHLLSTQMIYAVEDFSTNKFIAKAGTNAIGRHWVQLGGVFTEKNYRGRGIAAFMVKNLAEKITASGRKTALFVKNSNIPAQKAYAKAGFLPLMPFSICYF